MSRIRINYIGVNWTTISDKNPKKPHFWSFLASARHILTSKFPTNNKISFQKMFFHTLVCPYQHFSMTERLYRPFEKTRVKTFCPPNCTLNCTIDEPLSASFRHAVLQSSNLPENSKHTLPSE